MWGGCGGGGGRGANWGWAVGLGHQHAPPPPHTHTHTHSPPPCSYVDKAYAKAGTELKVVVRGKANDATVTKMPFVPTHYHKP